MTKMCVVCKKVFIPKHLLDTPRIFHSFPKNEKKKKDWMDITGVTQISTQSAVCSDHFSYESYHNDNPYAITKRLLPHAVPSVNITCKAPIQGCSSGVGLQPISNDDNPMLTKSNKTNKLGATNAEQSVNNQNTMGDIPDKFQASSKCEDFFSNSVVLAVVQSPSIEPNVPDELDTVLTSAELVKTGNIDCDNRHNSKAPSHCEKLISESPSSVVAQLPSTQSPAINNGFNYNSVSCGELNAVTSFDTGNIDHNKKEDFGLQSKENIISDCQRRERSQVLCTNNKLRSMLDCSEKSVSTIHYKRKRNKSLNRLTSKRSRERMCLGHNTFCKQEFKTEEAWNKFLASAAFVKKEMARLQMKDHYEKKKMEKFQKIVEALKKAHNTHVAQYLTVQK